MSIKRLERELKNIMKEPPCNCSAGLIDGDLYKWIATIIGPEGTPYEGGVFKLKIAFSDKYPMKPPRVFFETRIFHPNINEKGNICLDILKNNWSPVITVSKLLLSISLLLDKPNFDDPLNIKASNLYNNNKIEYFRYTQEFTRKHCENL